MKEKGKRNVKRVRRPQRAKKTYKVVKPARKLKNKTKRRIRHAVSIGLLLVSILFAVFRFSPVFSRFLQAIEDFGRSVAFYFLYYNDLEYLVTPTVREIPEGMDTVLPLTLEEFKALMREFWILFKNPAMMKRFCLTIGEKFSVFAYYFFSLLLPMIGVGLIVFLIYKAPDKSRKDSKPLWTYKRFRKKVLLSIKNEIKTYWKFLIRKRYIWIFAAIWAYNFNLLTIALEAFAFIFYVSMSMDYLNIFVQIAKLAVDLSVVAFFFPSWVWTIFSYKVFDIIRRKMGDKKLYKYIDKVKEFLKKHPGALFVVGKQRSKKTSMLTMLKIVCERYFREKAESLFKKKDKQFPCFSWRRLEETVEKCRKSGVFKTLDDMDVFAELLKRTYDEKDRRYRKYLKHFIFVKYGYDFNKFESYAESYPMTYNNGLFKVSIFEAIARYAQLYNIYSQTKPLDISNYSIREDFTFKRYGAFPIFDGKLLRKPKDSAKNTQYSHVMRGDAFRLGSAFDEETRNDLAIEYGIGVMQEVAKERKNQKTRSGSVKDLDANQANDLFELDTKMRGHVATIDNFDFWRWFFDDQRPDSLGADSKDLTTICHIKKTSEAKIVLPFFAVEEILYEIFEKIHDKIYYFIRSRKNGDTLLAYVLNNLFTPFFRHYDRISNRYSVYTSRIKTTDAMDKEVIGEAEKMYILSSVTYNNRFATDSCRVFYRKKHRKAKVTLAGSRQYQSLYPTQEDFTYMQSYMVEDMGRTAFGDNQFGRKKKKSKSKDEEDQSD